MAGVLVPGPERIRRLAAVAAALRPGLAASCTAARAPMAAEEQRVAAGPLTEADLEQWRRDGYVVLETRAPAADLEEVRAEIWKLAQRDENDPDTWYRRLPEGASRSGTRYPFEPSTDTVGSWRGQADLEVHMLGLWHSDSQWRIRQLKRVHGAFAQLWQTERLWVEVDCVNLKPPVN
eukprot:SAG22_NODE_7766_length_710_cov_0.942717_1_plen_177_part_01